MPIRKRRTTRRRVARRPARRMRGRGFLSSLWSKVKSVIPSFSTIHNYVKDNRLVSRGLNSLGYGQAADFASKYGYGRKRRTVRRRLTGRGLSTADQFKLMAVTKLLGGRRRRTTRRRTMRGGLANPAIYGHRRIVCGGRRRRVGRPRLRGRGVGGSTIGGLIGSFLPF